MNLQISAVGNLTLFPNESAAAINCPNAVEICVFKNGHMGPNQDAPSLRKRVPNSSRDIALQLSRLARVLDVILGKAHGGQFRAGDFLHV